ncbi:MAG: GNAT family N-acetyltransferase [Planctomycetes bacterium]|nr:GNAT family N-acetyltransferase [Planctomycetota bacterium]
MKTDIYTKNKEIRQKLLQLLQQVNADFYPPLSQRRPLKDWLDLFERGTIIYIQENNEILGFAVYYAHLTETMLTYLRPCVNMDPIVDTLGIPYSQGYIHFIATTQNARGKGVADQLMNALFQHAQQNNVQQLRVITWSTNIKSLQLYKKFKFHEYKRKQNDRGSGIDSIYLEIQLGENNDYEKK